MNALKNLLIVSSGPRMGYRSVSFFNKIKNSLTPDRYQPPYQHVVQIGDPALRMVSDALPVDLIKTPEISFLVDRLKHVRKAYSLVGLSAPQIGVNLRVFIAGFEKELLLNYTPHTVKVKEMFAMPLTIFINPEIKILEHRKITFEEGCASFVGYSAEVDRWSKIEISYFDENAEEKKEIFSGWNARILQHENDHLNGIMFTDIMDRKTLRCTNWEVINQKAGRIEIPYYPSKKAVFKL